ncbi:MAG: AAA family ATPase [Bacteroidetes bacterium GWA2_31_9]|nr:MAG: AAA family ATPase [Bacteroidetes bacterium GWA2_31_9]
MINRQLETIARKLFTKYPILSITGPRQSGKTTLLKYMFPELPYISLENTDERLFAINDPKGFLSNYPNGAILDEVQQTPELFSYIQTIVDEKNKTGMFVLSGSQNFMLLEKITQSLAGRVAILKLLPLSTIELRNANINIDNFYKLIFTGFYPAIYSREIESKYFYQNYIQTYIERDVRTLKNIGDLNNFTKFLQLCAGRTGQILNYSSLANDCDISVNTAKAWLSVLESSYIIFLLQPHYKNFNKRLIKMPKLYFYDTGLVASLLKINDDEQLKTHYLFGNLFENFIISEFQKYYYNSGLMSSIYFWRDNKGQEIDLIIENAEKLIPIEIKSSKTFSLDYFKNVKYYNNLSGNRTENSYVVYGSDKNYNSTEGKFISWKNLHDLFKIIL